MHQDFKNNQLEACRLEAVKGDKRLFDGVSFAVNSGEILRVAGINGAGKTTLLRILCGLGFADDGSVLWNNTNINSNRPDYYSALHYLGHQTGVKAGLTPNENLAFYQGINEQEPDQDAINQALDRVGLVSTAGLYCHSLSAGQRQRVAIARLLIISKPLWILDEPFTALDKQGQALLNNMLLEHIDKYGMVILTTHQDTLNPSLNLRTLELN